ncbi:MAG TPA: magnesium transporter CorA family protein [Candidatus Saccharimonadales bacterium]|nr:magnesium transporter CorA family protein [Candidatus Saccharimonadales bacterium]
MAGNNKKTNGSNITGLLNVFAKKPEQDPGSPRVSSTETQQHAGITWIDVQDPESGGLAGIGKQYDLQAIHINKSLQISHIARMEVEKKYIFLLLHFPYQDTGTNKVTTRQVMIFLGKDYLITVHDSETQTVRRLFESYKDKSATEAKSSARILFHLIGKMLEDVESLIQAVSIELDEIEDKVFDNETSDAQQISQLRHKIMRLRRTLATQKNVLEELDAIIDKFADEHLERYYTANTNRSIKLWETVEEARETIEIYKDADFTSSQERTNEILAILTIIFTLGIPATVLGTFYGMNILLPGGIETGPWTFFGKYTTLILVLSASITPAFGMYIYFKKRNWF